jgi:hypothetical protein
MFGWLMVLALLAGVTACSDDKKDDAKVESTDKGDSGDSGDGNTDSGNADVVAYCKAVDAYVQKAKDAMSDPAKAAALTSEGQDLAKQAQDLATANLSAEEAQEVADCTKKSTDALTGG